jgi:hypothetical protein
MRNAIWKAAGTCVSVALAVVLIKASTVTLMIGGCGDRPSGTSSSRPNARIDSQTWATTRRAIRFTGLRSPIRTGPYAGKGLSYYVLDDDPRNGNGIIIIISNTADDLGEPVSECRVELERWKEHVALYRNMPVPYDAASIADLYRHYWTSYGASRRSDK